MSSDSLSAARPLRAFLLTAIVAFGVLLGSVERSEAVSIQASSTSVAIGDVIDIAVSLDSGETVGAMDFIIGWNPSLVSPMLQATGSLFAGLSVGVDYAVTLSTDTSSTSRRRFLLLASQTAPDTVWFFRFLATSAGTATFNLAGQYASSFSGTNPVPFSGSVSTEITDPSAIPLPAGALLLISGLAGLSQLRRK